VPEKIAVMAVFCYANGMEKNEFENNNTDREISLYGMKIIKNLDGHSSTVELIEVNGIKYILKTADREDIWNERDFFRVLKENNLPTLDEFTSPDLKENQLLLEYIPESKGIDWQSVEDVEKWGKAVRQMHAVKFEKPFRIDENNEKQILNWPEHLKTVLDKAIQDKLDNPTEIAPGYLEKIRDYCYSKLEHLPKDIVLIHGDLHDGNTLIKNGEVVLYDKSSELFAGDPLYDLTIIMTHFPNGIYVETDNESNKRDPFLLQAFFKGYGRDVLAKDKELLDLYLIIRALDRYPNPFEIFNKQIIEKIVGKE
jgi:fructosamine-3-kinase